MVQIRILTQYLENYSDTDVPYWKKKGGHTFTIKDVNSDLVMYSNNLSKILANLVETENNEHSKYKYIEHEVLFQEDDYCIDNAMLAQEIQNYNGKDRKDGTTSSRNT
tara:strand:- start:415 stop:738 length:324 start_codon:yes stop_codon:yes gene_type:complete